VASVALVVAALLGIGDRAAAAPPASLVSFSSVPGFTPSFRPTVYDYVVRCEDGPVTVHGQSSGGWEWAINDGLFHAGNFVEVVPLSSGRAFVITVRQAGRAERFRYHVRCLPNNFPQYTFTRYGPVSPERFTVFRSFAPADEQYGMIFDRHGVPVWWIKGRVQGVRVLPDGNILWNNHAFSPSRWEIRRLDGSLVRTLRGVGRRADGHDLQFLTNGDHLIGSYVKQHHVDTSAYGGSSDASVINTELQQVSPAGQLVWRWKSQDHIALAETGRHWPWAVDHGYDIAHWNSIEPVGGSVIASFRHFDAVYKIRKSTGEIVWKLGGTSTPERLKVNGDPYAHTFGAQHDARMLPDGTLTVFDNRTNLREGPPRAVRFRINEQNGTATLLESISDPAVSVSYCCGSARRLDNGQWLISWAAGNNPIGGYEPNGARTFLLQFDTYFSARAQPVPEGAVSALDLRQGMRAMCSSGCG
jgi:Arylsulfotransferase (ASST)